ncbi:hypothetical protein ASF30_21535 [Leifsonia sp. Leaf264]|nr:hypothetical protein ASF30_21535 [Leifsonia sp. Leaf264]
MHAHGCTSSSRLLDLHDVLVAARLVGRQPGVTAISGSVSVDELVELETIFAIYEKARSISVIQARPFSARELEDWRLMDEWIA